MPRSPLPSVNFQPTRPPSCPKWLHGCNVICASPSPAHPCLCSTQTVQCPTHPAGGRPNVAVICNHRDFQCGTWRSVWGHGRGPGGGRGGCSYTPFADTMLGRGAAPAVTNLVPYGGGVIQLPATPSVQQQHRNPDLSNIYKVHNNWNVCFQCGFDIKEGHTSVTCPFKRWNHQDSFTCKNAQQFIMAGYNPCTKGMHKMVLPSNRNA